MCHRLSQASHMEEGVLYLEEKEIIKNIFADIYDVQKRYLYIPLDDYLWGHFVRELEEIQTKYKSHGAKIDRFCRDMIAVLTNYKEKEKK